jgi:glc operon protein GlcG
MKSDTTLSLADASQAIAAMTAELKKRKLAAVMAVADNHGELIALHRMDGAPLASVQIAMNKAWTAAREAKTSWDIGRSARDPVTGFNISYYSDPRYVGWGGGVPVLVKGKSVGSVAVSGLSETLDEELALIGVRAIEK